MKKAPLSERFRRPPKFATFQTYSNDHNCTLGLKYCPFSYAVYDSLKQKFEASQPPFNQKLQDNGS